MDKRRIAAGVIVLVLMVVLIIALSVGLSKRENGNGIVPAAVITGSCSPGWSGQFCDEALCSPMCSMHAMCTSPNNCSCNFGWKGSMCDTPMCTMPCTEHGSCTSPDTCTCQPGWNGLTCEMPTASGFTPSMAYRYKITSLYEMKEVNMMKNSTESRGYDSNVTIVIEVKSYDNGNSTIMGTLVIEEVICNASLATENGTSNLIPSCPQNISDTLSNVDISFCQNSKTGKITHVSYMKTDEGTAMFIAYILKFLDYETSADPSDAQGYSYLETSPSGEKHNVSWRRERNLEGMDCYNFKRTLSDDDMMAEDIETKQVCMSAETQGAPATVMMMQAFEIGQNMTKYESVPLTDMVLDSVSVTPLPSLFGTVAAYGKLMSAKSMGKLQSEKEYYRLRSWMSLPEVLTIPLKSLVQKKPMKKEILSESDKMSEIQSAVKSIGTHRALPILLRLIKKDESSIHTINNMLTERKMSDAQETRSLLIASLGTSQVTHGQHYLAEILSSNESVSGDHFLALGSVAQIRLPRRKVYDAVKRHVDSDDEEIRNRALLVFGILGGRGWVKETSDKFKELLRSSKEEEEAFKVITALGNMHSKTAKNIIIPFTRSKHEIVKRAAVRALRNVCEAEDSDILLDVFRKTPSRFTALECLKSLQHCQISNKLASSLVEIASNSSDSDILTDIKLVFESCSRNADMFTRAICASGQEIVECRLTSKQHELKSTWSEEYRVGAQNLAVVYGGDIFTENSGRLEKDFNINFFVDGEAFGTRFRLLEAGSSTSFISSTTFMTFTFARLTLFNKKFDLFTKVWKSTLPFGVINGDSCQPNIGKPKFTIKEHFDFFSIGFSYGIRNVASFDLGFKITGTVQFGYGLNVITTSNDFSPRQLNAIAQPQFRIGGELTGGVSAMVVSGGIGGSVDIANGALLGNIATNLDKSSFCYQCTIKSSFLSGRLFAYVEIGFYFSSKTWEYDIFSWKGIENTRTLTSKTCCQQKLSFGSLKIPRSLRVGFYGAANVNKFLDGLRFKVPKNVRLFFKVCQNIFHCRNNITLEHGCFYTQTHYKIMRRVHLLTVDESSKAYLNLKDIYEIDGFIPVAETLYGETFVSDQLGRIFTVAEPEGIMVTPTSPNLQSFLHQVIETGLPSLRSALPLCQASLPTHLSTNMPVLDLRSYYERMPRIVNLIRNGIRDHTNTLVYLNNPEIRRINMRLSCSKYSESKDMTYPYVCCEYPFAFTLKGGGGATVDQVSQTEYRMRQEVINDFIKRNNFLGGEVFRVEV